MLILSALALTIVAGCSSNKEVILFDGQAFRAKVSKDRDARRNFFATVSPVSASTEGAREAGRYEGIKYCIMEYGTSNILWTLSPDAEPQTWSLDGDTVTFSGTCRP
ncbi:hypothetical protein OAN15_00715 [bacterium]|nr:hypothetical protein [bacterium]